MSVKETVIYVSIGFARKHDSIYIITAEASFSCVPEMWVPIKGAKLASMAMNFKIARSLFILAITPIQSIKTLCCGRPYHNFGEDFIYFKRTLVDCSRRKIWICLEHIFPAFMLPNYGKWKVILLNNYAPHSKNVCKKYGRFAPWLNIASTAPNNLISVFCHIYNAVICHGNFKWVEVRANLHNDWFASLSGIWHAMFMHGVNYELLRMWDDTHVSILHGETHAFYRRHLNWDFIFHYSMFSVAKFYGGLALLWTKRHA